MKNHFYKKNIIAHVLVSKKSKNLLRIRKATAYVLSALVLYNKLFSCSLK